MTEHAQADAVYVIETPLFGLTHITPCKIQSEAGAQIVTCKTRRQLIAWLALHDENPVILTLPNAAAWAAFTNARLLRQMLLQMEPTPETAQ